METIVKLYSSHEYEINRFLNSFFAQNQTKQSIQNDNQNNFDYSIACQKNSNKTSTLEWQKKYQNPLEMVDIIGTFIENNDKFKINMWISLDKNIFINVTDNNADKIIRYLYERYPW